MALIVLAEDEPDIRTLAEIRLHRAGHELVSVDNGTDALEVATSREFDMAIFDWMMPGLSGIEVCAALRANPLRERLKIMLFSARAQDADLETAYAAGVDDFVIKPFRPAELEKRVTALLARG